MDRYRWKRHPTFMHAHQIERKKMMPLKLLRRTPTAGQRHPSPLLRLVPGLLLLLLISRPAAASASTVVTHLPGFDGPLPFHLETGYVGVEEETGAELFYYLVESERSPGAAPVLLWLTGGPRCSGFSAFAFEVGPVKFVLAPYDGGLPQLVYNPLSWTKMASIIFLDSPVSSGFSYARDPKGCDDVGDYSSSLQVQRFLNKVTRRGAVNRCCAVMAVIQYTDRSMPGLQWFTDHPQYLSNPFYIGGDSYAGKVVPLIAQYVSEGIDKRQQPRINLKASYFSSIQTLLYTNSGYLVGNPMTDPKFDRNFQVQAAHGFGIISDQIYEAAMRNCKGDYINHVNQMCAEVLQTVKSTYGYYLSYFWMNNNMTRDALGVKQGTVGEWVRCKRELPYKFDMPSSIPYHLNLTMRGYRALVYRFTMGYANNLTFATVKGGGHIAPEYRPEECFAMAERWLANEPL
uniref:Serine carboxypeptidase-like protein 9 n=1 Tax=Aegilops tauschii TaxID=37682 RepID=M8B2X0_AEGTA